MATVTTPIGHFEKGRIGDEIYQHDLKEILEATEMDRLVAIDITTRKFALGDTVLQASDALQKETGADPENIWLVRVGSEAVYQRISITVQ